VRVGYVVSAFVKTRTPANVEEIGTMPNASFQADVGIEKRGIESANGGTITHLRAAPPRVEGFAGDISRTQPKTEAQTAM
jgi:hypothetical protein